MNRYLLQRALGALVILIAMVACVLPGQAIQTAPAMDPIAIDTAVAGTAQAAAEQTAAAQPSATVVTGTSIEQLADGTTKYSDYDAGFEIIFPVGWLAVRPNSEEFNAALGKEGAANSGLRAQMEFDQAEYDANFDRLYAYILRPDIEKNIMFGFSKLTWDAEDPRILDSVVMGEIVRGLESSGDIPGFRADTAQLHEDGNVKLMEIGGRFTLTDEQGESVPLYATVIFFKPSPTSTARITFTFVQDYHTQIAADVKLIVESIRIIAP